MIIQCPYCDGAVFISDEIDGDLNITCPKCRKVLEISIGKLPSTMFDNLEESPIDIDLSGLGSIEDELDIDIDVD